MLARSLVLPGADGIQVHALAWSETGVPLVFVHGFGHDAHVWDEIAPAVGPYYHTLAITLRGHGDSGGECLTRHGPQLAADLETAFDALGFERVVLVGHSLGGRVALEYAARNPRKLAGLVLVDAAPELDARGTSRIRDEVRSQLGRSDPSFASVDDYLRVLERQYPAARKETLARLAEHWTRRRDDGRYELKLTYRPPEDEKGTPTRSIPSSESREERDRATVERLWATLRSLPCPALVVRGAASDVLSADVAEKMAGEVLPNGRLAVIPKAGHSVPLDNPDALTRALTDFVLG